MDAAVERSCVHSQSRGARSRNICNRRPRFAPDYRSAKWRRAARRRRSSGLNFRASHFARMVKFSRPPARPTAKFDFGIPSRVPHWLRSIPARPKKAPNRWRFRPTGVYWPVAIGRLAITFHGSSFGISQHCSPCTSWKTSAGANCGRGHRSRRSDRWRRLYQQWENAN